MQSTSSGSVLCFAGVSDWKAVEELLRLQPPYTGVNTAVRDIVKNGNSIKRQFPEPTHVLVEFESEAERAAGHARGLLTFTTDPLDEDPETCPLTITSLFVRAEARRAGIGRRMVKRVVRVGNKHSINSINIMSELHARPFWESLGFRAMPMMPVVCETINMFLPLDYAERLHIVEMRPSGAPLDRNSGA
jgi:GNAT superfamily N-acetyltransferase